MIRCSSTVPQIILALMLLHATGLSADDAAFPRLDPTAPEKAVETFRVLDGFRMELIASEPLVADPVDMAYDENGRAYVVEMRGYPLPELADAEDTNPIGRVRLLEDDNGDGIFDRSEIFVDGLSWPTSVVLWKGGVFVAAAPDIWYFKDTTGDRKADVRRKVYTGFSRYNVQAIMNNMRWGLDHRIYGAASGNGGEVKPADKPDAAPVMVKRRDFRFDPVGGELEAISGGARFGNSFDDWGNRFLCNIRNPAQHVVLPSEYLSRNPHLAVSKTIHDAAEAGDQIPVYRISPPEPWREVRARRWAAERMNYPQSELVGAGFFTSSSGVTIYRGAAYPEPYRGNVFVSDVAANIIHRQTLEPDGPTFKARRADDGAEFVASTDNWFRPVNFVNAPDGTLHVLDMYRETIEHPWSIPDDIKAKLDLEAGNDMGRIYRLVPPEFAATKPPRLGEAAADELVRHLESPNAWWRETAHRLIFERQDGSAVEPLRRLLVESRFALARLHALWSLKGLSALTSEDVERGLADPVAGIREHAVKLAESRLAESPALRQHLLKLAGDPDARVRFQVAFTLGEMIGPEAVEALALIARRDAADEWTRVAILSSCAETAAPLLALLLSAEPTSGPGSAELLRELAVIAGAGNRGDEIRQVLAAVGEVPAEALLDLQYAVVSGLGEGLRRNRQTLATAITDAPPEVKSRVEQLLGQALDIAVDPELSPGSRVQAIALLRQDSFERVAEPLAGVLTPQHPREVQLAAVRVLGSFLNDEVAPLLLGRWRQLTPPVRGEAIEILLGRQNWIGPFLDEIEAGRILASQVPVPRRAYLANNRDAAIKDRAARIFGPEAPSPRNEVIAAYRTALSLKPDPAAGAKIFRRECMTCHKSGGEGHDVGPALSSIRHRAPEEILIHILDPNREVSPNYLDYAVVLKDGRVLTGVIASETETSLTLRRAENAQDTVLRADIEEIASTGKSIMPEGVEQKVTPQEMADLIAFLLKG